MTEKRPSAPHCHPERSEGSLPARLQSERAPGVLMEGSASRREDPSGCALRMTEKESPQDDSTRGLKK